MFALVLLGVVLIGAAVVITCIYIINKKKKKNLINEIGPTPPLSRNPSREVADTHQKYLKKLPKLQVDTPSNDSKPFIATEENLNTPPSVQVTQKESTDKVAGSAKLSDNSKPTSQGGHSLVVKQSQEDPIQLSSEILPAVDDGEQAHSQTLSERETVQKGSETKNPTLTDAREELKEDIRRDSGGRTLPGGVEETEVEVHEVSGTQVEDDKQIETWSENEDNDTSEKIAGVTADIHNTNEEIVERNKEESIRLESDLGSLRNQEMDRMELEKKRLETDVESSLKEQENTTTKLDTTSNQDIGQIEPNIMSGSKEHEIKQMDLEGENSKNDKGMAKNSNAEQNNNQGDILALGDNETQTDKTSRHGKSNQAEAEPKTEENALPTKTDQKPKDSEKLTDQQVPKEKEKSKSVESGPVKSVESAHSHKDKPEHTTPRADSATKPLKKRSLLAEQPPDDESEVASKRDRLWKLKKIYTPESTESSLQGSRSGKKATKKLSGHKDKRIYTAAKDAVDSQQSLTSPSPRASRLDSSEPYHRSQSIKTPKKNKSPTKHWS